MVLGQENYGLYGIVGSMVVFVSFLNTQLSDALARFYSVSIGRVKSAVNQQEAIEECRAWFSCGVAIHLVVPFILLMIGYPCGVYALENGWLSVPPDRLNACVWLWRFSCLSSFVSMVNSPFQAMYIAKQYIAELTVYSFAQTAIRTAFVFLMTIIPGDWLLGYGLGMCLIAVVPQLLICWRAFCVFDECQLRKSALFDRGRIRQVSAFAWWKLLGGIGYIARHQCLEIIVNRHFGPRANASYTVASTFGVEASALTGALNGAFGPVVSSAFGEGRFEYMRKMALRSGKFGTLLTLIFAIPMFLEAEEVLRIWLKNPPENALPMCLVVLGVVVIEKLTAGHYMAVSAVGDICGLMIWRGVICLLAIPSAIFFTWLKPDVVSVPVALLVTTAAVAVSDVYYAKVKASIGVFDWMKTVLLPLTAITVLSAGFGRLVVAGLSPSFFRVCVTTLAVLSALVPFAWVTLFDSEEKGYIVGRVKSIIERGGLK